MFQRGQISNPDDALTFMLAGKATVTLRSVRTEKRFTFKIKQAKERGTKNPIDGLFFVALMNGPDNETNFQYMGTIRNNVYELGRKSHLTTTAPSHVAFDWFWKNMRFDDCFKLVELWHEGRCGKCNRKLTVPESIERGIGPECAKTHTRRHF